MSDIGIFFMVAVLLGCLLFAIGYARRSRDASRPAREPLEPYRARIALGGAHPEIPLSQRKRVLKICPDCREYVLLEAPVCKYCGCALAIAATAKPPSPGK